MQTDSCKWAHYEQNNIHIAPLGWYILKEVRQSSGTNEQDGSLDQ